MAKTRKQLESVLTPQKRKAAQLIVDNDWLPVVNEDGRKKTLKDIADEVGIARSTLFEWRTDEDFVEYVNYLTDIQLSAMRSEVNVAIMRAIRGGNNGLPSVKAIEIFMKRWALLSNVDIVNAGSGGSEDVDVETLKDRIERLKQRKDAD